MLINDVSKKLIYPFWSDCIKLYEMGLGNVEDIDKVCELGLGHPKGPFKLIDEMGLDVFYKELKIFYEKTKDRRYKVPELLIKMVRKGYIGKKIKKGFYDYINTVNRSKDNDVLQVSSISRQIKKVGVIGFGSMGRGIVQVVAGAGFKVIVRETDDVFLQKGMNFIDKMLNIGVEKKKITEREKTDIINRIEGTTSFEALKDSDIVIEAVFEKLDLKKEIFAQIDKIVRPDAVLATNTSCLSVSEISTATKRPDKVCGLHFFNPVPLMRLVEIIRGAHTSDETLKKVVSFSIALGKEPVECKDSPGFIANRILCPYLFHAIREYESGLATKEEIDNSIKLATGFPMGPLALTDLIGLDICLDIGELIFKATGDSSLKPPSLLGEMVKSGLLGKKSGKGFYSYSLM